MTSKFVVRNIFKLSGDVTVLACEGDGGPTTFVAFTGKLLNGGELRQSISFCGEKKMLNQTRPNSFRAFETIESVQLSIEEAQSGKWVLTIDD
jgi:hypothetical protein